MARASTRDGATIAGIVAGPLYVIVAAMQVVIRPGFDLTRHTLSLLSNGDLGWIQIANFIATGALLVAAAPALKHTLASGRGATWAPRMLATYGFGLIGAGIFRADPALGFPPGTPVDATSISWHGLLHFIVGTIGFAGFIGACFIVSRRFRDLGRTAWSAFSAVTGTLFLVSFIGIASGSNGPVSLYFTLAVTLGFIWLTLVFITQRHLPMWMAEHSIETTASPAAIWRLWGDVAHWSDWIGDIDAIELSGPFAAGSIIRMTPFRQDTVELRIVEAVTPELFVDEAHIGDLLIRTTHRIERLTGGRVRVVYRMEISGPEADTSAAEIGSQISGDFPQTLASLAKRAERMAER